MEIDYRQYYFFFWTDTTFQNALQCGQDGSAQPFPGLRGRATWNRAAQMFTSSVTFVC